MAKTTCFKTLNAEIKWAITLKIGLLLEED